MNNYLKTNISLYCISRFTSYRALHTLSRLQKWLIGALQAIIIFLVVRSIKRIDAL